MHRDLLVRRAGPAVGTTATGMHAAGTTAGAPVATGSPPATTAQWSPRGTTASVIVSRRPGACPSDRWAAVCMRLRGRSMKTGA